MLSPFLAYVQFSRNVAVKRAMGPLVSGASSVVSALVVHALSGSVVLAVVVGAVGLFFRRANPMAAWFCDRCGRTIRRSLLLPAGSHCPYCGAPLYGRDGSPR